MKGVIDFCGSRQWYAYYPFGEDLGPQSGRWNPFRFAGSYRDQESANKYQYYMGARYHDPAYGRFSQADYWEPGFLTPQTFTPLQYSYVMNNPLIFTDPTGHFCWGCLGRAVGGSVMIAVGAVGFSVSGAIVVFGAVAMPPVILLGLAGMGAGLGLMKCGIDVVAGADMCFGQPPNRLPMRLPAGR